MYNPLIASEVKLELLEYYNDETEIYYVRAAGIKGEESIRKIPLYELRYARRYRLFNFCIYPKRFK